MFSSLPDYRRFTESALQRLRKSDKQTAYDRRGRIVFNLVLLAGLWGVPLYARWMFLSDTNATQPISEAVVGEWRQGDRGATIRFTSKGELQLIGPDSVVETAGFWINGDTLLVSGFARQPGDHRLSIEPQRYQISIRGNLLIVKSVAVTVIPEHARQEEMSSLHGILPPWSGVTVQFQRVATP